MKSSEKDNYNIKNIHMKEIDKTPLKPPKSKPPSPKIVKIELSFSTWGGDHENKIDILEKWENRLLN